MAKLELFFMMSILSAHGMLYLVLSSTNSALMV